MKNMKLKWSDYHFKINNNVLSTEKIKKALKSFQKDILKMYNKDQFMTILIKVRFSEIQIRSLSHSQILKIAEYRLLYSIFKEYFDIRDDDYKNFPVEEIILTYTIHPLEKVVTQKISRAKSFKKGMTFTFSGYKLPKTMDITKWGEFKFSDDYCKAVISKPKSNSKYYVSFFENFMEVSLKNKEITILSWTDYMRDGENLNSFTRKIMNKHEYIFEDGKLIIKKIKRKTQFLKPLKLSLFRSENIITMDLETKEIVEGDSTVLIPVCVSIYDGKEKKSFYISNFSSKDEMLNSSIIYLMKRKYSGHKVFLHNFSYFDGIFLMRTLSNLADKLTPIIRDGRFIDLRFKYGKHTLYFRDSYLLLPSSLASLAKNFGVENKGIFPYHFLNSIDSMNYLGDVPSFKYFRNISNEQYTEYCSLFINKIWDMKVELIKYCEQDVITLYQIIDKFSQDIFKLFRIDLLKYPTLSSLALGIYRAKFLTNFNIPLINGEIYEDIKEGYTGGAVDVYKPYGENIYRYDVNSLYPSVMKVNKMPVGVPIFFKGDIFKIDPKAFGFFEAEVETPSDLNIPILQYRFKSRKGGFKTIAPLGTWKGIFFSEEIKNSMKSGYKFKILKGYLFESKNIFQPYVDFLYELKMNSIKGSPNYIIAKLLLNSLYGRLGMSPYMNNHLITSEEESIKFSEKQAISNLIDLQNGKVMFSYIDKKESYTNRTLNVSVPISAAVTAYARMHMSQFKLMKGYTIFYSDTDSIDLDRPLDSKYIGPDLGKMKMEHIFSKAVYLAPKVYGGVTSEHEYVKVKGLKTTISFKELFSLLDKDSKLNSYQDKWYRNISKGEITINNEIYTLMVTDNKRELIYNSNKKLIGTKPLEVHNGLIK